MTSTQIPDVGYSGTSLAKKLGLKDGQFVVFCDLPDDLDDLRTARAFGQVEMVNPQELGNFEGQLDVVHLFTKERMVLEAHLDILRHVIKPAGMVWISWPKKAAKVPTDVTEDVLREIFLPSGLVDVKVCAVNEIWSGLKFMIRKELR